MTNEEMQAKIASVKSFDDAYKMAREGGYTGTAEAFLALVAKAADEIDPMSADDMENVAGGFGDSIKNGINTIGSAFSTAADYVSTKCGQAIDWVKENPALTAEIAGGVALVGIAVGTSVAVYRRNQNTLQPGQLVVLGGNTYKYNGDGNFVSVRP